MNWNDASLEVRFRGPEKAGQKRIYVSVDYFYGRLYYLMLRELVENRLPYEFVYSPAQDAVPERVEDVGRSIEERIRSCHFFLYICSYHANREDAAWRQLDAVNRQNFEVDVARRRDMPLLMFRPQSGLEIPEGLKRAQYVETKALTGKSVEKLIRDGMKYW